MLRGLPTLALVATLLAAAPAGAHHSTAMFEWGTEVQLEGVVNRFEWTNPHVFIYVTTIERNGKIGHYAFEGTSPNHLSRYGWSKHSLEVGDKVTIGYHPLKDKRAGGFCVFVTKADGTRLEQLPTVNG